MADERLRTKRELKSLFTNLKRKGITDSMISILIDTLWRDRSNQRTSGFFYAGGFDTQFSFNVETRIFSIIPFDPLVEGYEPRYSIFSWSNVAILHRIFNPYEIEIPNEEGLFCVYFDKEPDPGTAQILFCKKNPTQQELQELYYSNAIISFLYWDATNNEVLHLGDDRHGSEWNPQIHWYIHKTSGAKRKSGLQFTGFSINGDGSSDAHAKFSVIGGTMLHDDFSMTIPSSSDSIPILYSFGNLPRFITHSGYAFAGAGRAYFNSGHISVEEAASGNYVLYHIFATNEILSAGKKIISVMGTAQYTSLADAFLAVNPELDIVIPFIPFQGKCYLGTVIIQTDDNYTNTTKSRIVSIVGADFHPPVSIAENSENLLEINEKQELSIPGDFEADEFYAIKNRIWQKITVGSGTGEDGREIELSNIYNHVVWRYVGDATWIDLFEVPASGDNGRGIVSIVLHATVGLIKTYRITYTDATFFDFDITNGINGGGGGGVTQVTGLTLLTSGWVADGSLFKYVLSHASILATSSVEVIPDNSSYDVLVVAEPMQKTVSAAGSVSIWMKIIPSADIPVTINITPII